MRKSNRRQFLGGLLAAGAASGLTGCAGFPSILSTKSPNSKLCHACVGTHGMAMADLKSLITHPKLEIVALCDVDLRFAAEAKKLVPQARIYQDWRELLEAEGDRIDSLNVSTPDHTHTIIAANAMRRGKHVYCQKPLCKKIDECRLLRRIAEEEGVVTQLGTQFAASAGDRQTVQLLRDGVIGPVSRVYLYSTRNGASRGKRSFKKACAVPSSLDWNGWIGPAPMRDYAPGYHPILWRHWLDFGSGWIGDLCIHVISAPWIGMNLGDLAPISVSAIVDPEAMKDPVYRQCWPRYSHITWDFPGVPASGGRPFKMDWISGVQEDPTTLPDFLPIPEYEALFPKTPLKTRSFEGRVIEGEHGWILAPHTGTPYALLRNGQVVKPAAPAAEPSHYHEFVDRCFDGKAARSSFAWTTHMMESVIMGGVCEQLPGRKFFWDAKNSRFNSPDATELLWSNYREGWKLKGLMHA